MIVTAENGSELQHGAYGFICLYVGERGYREVVFHCNSLYDILSLHSHVTLSG